MPGERSILKTVFTNFINSLKPRQFTGKLVGKDYNGTEYYEIPPGPNRRKTARYFTPKSKAEEDFEQDIPAEWESWLRYRRQLPPEEKEILENKAIADMKKKNALELKLKAGQSAEQLSAPNTGKNAFPRYDEYELVPGRTRDGKK